MTLTCPACHRPHCPAIDHDFRNGVVVFACACGHEWQNPPADFCAYRGSAVCRRCPYLDEIEMECEWDCANCTDRGFCPCSVAESGKWVEKEEA